MVPWWIWVLVWLACTVLFGVVETYAMTHRYKDGHAGTLSYYINYVATRWPLSTWFGGVFAGMMATHLYSGWCM